MITGLIIAIVCLAIGYSIGYTKGAYDKPLYDFTEILFRAYLDEKIRDEQNN